MYSAERKKYTAMVKKAHPPSTRELQDINNFVFRK